MRGTFSSIDAAIVTLAPVAREIPCAMCRKSPAGRQIDEGHVAALASSIIEIGLLQPIVVRATGDTYQVMAGMHRLSAFEYLGRQAIPAFVRADDDLAAELALIDENLVRLDLTPAERAAATARRKAIYEALHPETAHGGDRKSSRKDCDLNEPRFTEATARATGRAERTVQLDAQRGEAIGPVALGRIKGTSLDSGRELDALARLPAERRDPLIERAAAGAKVSAHHEVKKVAREERERALGARQRALPDKRYGVIYADPPWRFEPRSRETGMDRAADNHYPTLEEGELQSLDVGRIAAPDCVLFLWATVPMLPYAFTVLASWGFAYRSHCVWKKVFPGGAKGTGYWWRNEHELLILGVRGNPPCPAPGLQWGSVINAPVGRHSEKPGQFRQMIEAYFPTLPKIELYAREAAEGWDAWGNEIDAAGEPASVNPGLDPGANQESQAKAGDDVPATEGPQGQVGAENDPASRPSPAPAAAPGDEGGGPVDGDLRPPLSPDVSSPGRALPSSPDVFGPGRASPSSPLEDDPDIPAILDRRRPKPDLHHELMAVLQRLEVGPTEVSGAVEAALREGKLAKFRKGEPHPRSLAAAGRRALEAWREDERERAAHRERLAALPEGLDELIKLYDLALSALDAAVIAGDGAEAARTSRRLRDILEKANGGTSRGVSNHEGPVAIRKACRAKPGQVPRWGQEGAFIASSSGVTAIVAYDGYWSIRAVGRTEPFPSETGFQSLAGAPDFELARTVEEFGRELIDASIRSANDKRNHGKGLVIPERCYRFDADGGLQPDPPYKVPVGEPGEPVAA